MFIDLNVGGSCGKARGLMSTSINASGNSQNDQLSRKRRDVTVLAFGRPRINSRPKRLAASTGHITIGSRPGHRYTTPGRHVRESRSPYLRDVTSGSDENQNANTILGRDAQVVLRELEDVYSRYARDPEVSEIASEVFSTGGVFKDQAISDTLTAGLHKEYLRSLGELIERSLQEQVDKRRETLGAEETRRTGGTSTLGTWSESPVDQVGAVLLGRTVNHNRDFNDGRQKKQYLMPPSSPATPDNGQILEELIAVPRPVIYKTQPDQQPIRFTQLHKQPIVFKQLHTQPMGLKQFRKQPMVFKHQQPMVFKQLHAQPIRYNQRHRQPMKFEDPRGKELKELNEILNRMVSI